MVKRIQQFIESLHISIRAFEQNIGASNGLIRKAIANQTDIQSKWVSAIVDNYPQLNAGWLVSGKGDMLKSSDLVYESGENLVTIPIVDVFAAAGYGYFNPNLTEQTGEIKIPTTMLRRRMGNYYCGLVHGDSMYPTLLDRDYIIFRLLQPNEWVDIRDNEVYFIIDRAGAAYVKRIINRLREENCIVCRSDNRDGNFPDFNIMSDEVGHIYHVECRLSNNMSNLNDRDNQLRALISLREDVKEIKEKLKNT
jgi:phage repressor protein C with HTH and peptisase S24 domain